MTDTERAIRIAVGVLWLPLGIVLLALPAHGALALVLWVTVIAGAIDLLVSGAVGYCPRYRYLDVPWAGHRRVLTPRRTLPRRARRLLASPSTRAGFRHARRRTTPVVCVSDDRPLDRARWDAAVAGLPPLGEPVQRRWADLPTTAIWKVRRPELARLLDAAAQDPARGDETTASPAQEPSRRELRRPSQAR